LEASIGRIYYWKTNKYCDIDLIRSVSFLVIINWVNSLLLLRFIIYISLLLCLINPSASHAESQSKLLLYSSATGTVSVENDQIKTFRAPDGHLVILADDVAKYCKKRIPNNFAYLLLPFHDFQGKKTLDVTKFAEFIGAEIDASVNVEQIPVARELLKKITALDEDTEVTYNRERKMFCTNIDSGGNDAQGLCADLSSKVIYHVANSELDLLYNDGVPADMNSRITDSKSYLSDLLGIQYEQSTKLYLARCTETRLHFAVLLSNGNVKAKWQFTFDPRTSKITNYELDSKSGAKDVLFFITNSNFEKARYKTAIATGNMLLQSGKPGTGIYKREEVYRIIGLSYYRIGETNKALEYLNQFARYSNDPLFFSGISELYQSLNRNKEAVSFATKAVHLSKTKESKEESILYRAKLHLKIGEAEAAKADFRVACKMGNNEACNFLLR
jgi:hypothetical protein